MQILRIDRETKFRIAAAAELLSYKTESGKHYGQLTGKDLGVLEALLRLSGTSVSVKTIAAKADCSRSSVPPALRRLSAVGVLTTDENTITFATPKQSVPIPPWIALLDLGC